MLEIRKEMGMVRQANSEDTNIINDIFLDVVLWMQKNKLKQWRFHDLDWDVIPFNIDHFFICFDHENNAVGFMILSPYDISNAWNKWELPRSLYIYKLAVKRKYAKLGFSTELLSFSKVFANENYYNNLCLYCQAKRLKLRNLYEKNGFIYIGEQIIKNELDISSFYVFHLN